MRGLRIPITIMLNRRGYQFETWSNQVAGGPALQIHLGSLSIVRADNGLLTTSRYLFANGD